VPVQITPERPDGPAAASLILELEAVLAPLYPAASRHGYSIEKLLAQGVTFFVTRVDGAPAGCGGVQAYPGYAEVKRMYVRPAYRGQGLARHMLDRLAKHARGQGLSLLRLETGIHQVDAIRLYERYGFRRVGPFGEYRDDPNSMFFEMDLTPPAPLP
jgi:ribosomal protein S18 acetylase RimI-like enzyme